MTNAASKMNFIKRRAFHSSKILHWRALRSMQASKKQLKSKKLCFHFCHLSVEMLKSTINQCQRKTSDPSDLKVMSVHQFSFNQVNNNLAGNKMKMKCLKVLLASKKKHLTISETAAIQPHMD